jgi:hypothetical protein
MNQSQIPKPFPWRRLIAHHPSIQDAVEGLGCVLPGSNIIIQFENAQETE